MQDWLEPLVGGIVLVITLLDVFLTVLYARAGTGLLAPGLARGVWRVFRGLSGGRNAGILTYCGPAQLVAVVLMWGLLLALGSGLVIHPALGTGVKSSAGTTDTDFVTALFVGGSSMSIVGASDYGPTSAGYKLLFLFNSLVGLSVTSLTLTYLMQVYSALRTRNALGLMVHGQSGETGDAAELLARWGPRGRFDGGYNNLSTLAGEVAAIKETHHFYPVLFYFRFEDTFYGMSRVLLIVLDAEPSADRARSRERWIRRYEQALQRLREAGIPTRADPEAGAREYVELRATWEPGIEALAPALGFRMEDVDLASFTARPRAARG